MIPNGTAAACAELSLSPLSPPPPDEGATEVEKPGAVKTPVEVRVREPEEMVVVKEEVTPGAVISVPVAVVEVAVEVEPEVVVVVSVVVVAAEPLLDSVEVAEPVELGTILAPLEVTATP